MSAARRTQMAMYLRPLYQGGKGVMRDAWQAKISAWRMTGKNKRVTRENSSNLAMIREFPVYCDAWSARFKESDARSWKPSTVLKINLRDRSTIENRRPICTRKRPFGAIYSFMHIVLQKHIYYVTRDL